MDYKIFIMKLYIKGTWMVLNSENNTKTKLIKEELTKQLFLSSVNNPSTITDKRNSLNVFKGYNRGNSIEVIANDILGDLNEQGIKDFLNELFHSNPDEIDENVQIICNRFRDDIPDITAENICEKIAEFFIVEVLKPVTKKIEQRNDISDHTPIYESGHMGGCDRKDANENTHNINDSYSIDIDDVYKIPIPVCDKQRIQQLLLDVSVSLDSISETAETLGKKMENHEWSEVQILFPDEYEAYQNERNTFKRNISQLDFYSFKYPYNFFSSVLVRLRYCVTNSFIEKEANHRHIKFILPIEIIIIKNMLGNLSFEIDRVPD